MQYGKALERYLRHILLADPRYGPIYMLKCDLADGYYRLGLIIKDIPKLAVVFPSTQHQNPLLALPLVLPMGWKNSGPAFYAATKTVTNMANADVQNNVPQQPHPLDTLAQTMDYNTKPKTTTSSPHQKPQNFPPINQIFHCPTPKRVAYINIFVDDFIALVQ